MLTPEQHCLLARAREVWSLRGEAKAHGMPFGEETVTELVLLQLKRHYPGRIWIVPFNKREEAKIGADWEWCFTDHRESTFLPMLVQAKVLDDQDKAYGHIGRTIGNTGKRQIDQLLETAERRNVPAVYAFYNHVSDTHRIHRSCGSLEPSFSQYEPWGISIADAQEIHDLSPDHSFDRIQKRSRPLHCMMCAHGNQKNLPPRGSPDAIFRAMARDYDSPLISAEDRWKPKREPPDYYNIVRELGLGRDGESSRAYHHETMREKLAASNPGLDGILILADGRRSRT